MICLLLFDYQTIKRLIFSRESTWAVEMPHPGNMRNPLKGSVGLENGLYDIL